jgi:hypothetical protein
MQPLGGSTASAISSSSAAAVSNQSAAASISDQSNSGVKVRWKTSARITANQPATGATNQAAPVTGATNGSSLAARTFEANKERPAATVNRVQQVSAQATSYSSGNAATQSNPLRSGASVSSNNHQVAQASTFVPRGNSPVVRSAVQPAAFQDPAGNAIAPPNLDAPGAVPNLGAPPALNQQGNFPPNNFPPAPGQDALETPEAAPVPPVAPVVPDEFPQAPRRTPEQDQSPAAPMPGNGNDLRAPSLNLDNANPPSEDPTNPFKNRGQDDLASPSDRESERRARELERKRVEPDASANCESFRDKLRNASIQKINLNSAPRYGQGMYDDPEKAEKQRLDFASSSEVREWCDRRGRNLVTGRLIDLVNEQVVLDCNGVRREIPLRDLCDVDLAYVGKVWHLPISCGSGPEEAPGRSFVPSAVQWKASGLCHKPLYFEEVQLERYGHEVGPVLQPLISTAHFFGNIAVLPYKMGIHPPHECQYSLGYYRPGDCAPYMLPPVPISLRGAAAQAGAVVGGAALLP